MQVIDTPVCVGVKNDNFRSEVWSQKYGGSVDGVLCWLSEEIESLFSQKARKEIVDDLIGGNSKRQKLSDCFFSLFSEGYAFPGGRVIAAASLISKALDEGEKMPNITPMNCFVIPIEEDSIDGIMDAAKNIANTYKYGGGVGFDISGLRPNDSKVNNSARTTTGPVSFLPIYDEVTGRVGQKGRRGAALKAIHIQHPDSLQFIQSKRNNKLSNMNISVKISDEFMSALSEDREITLWYPKVLEDPLQAQTSRHYLIKTVQYIAECYDFYGEYEFFYVESDKTYRRVDVYGSVPAREIWNEIIDCAWETGDPGVIFWDNMLRDCPFNYTLIRLSCTNPCGEEPLAAWMACNLGAMNVSKYVNPKKKRFDWEKFKKDVRTMVVFLDGVITWCVERNLLPLEKQKEIMKKLRPIGLGITGLADAFLALGMGYGDEDSYKLATKIASVKEDESYKISINLGSILGSFELFDYNESLENAGHFSKFLKENEAVREFFERKKSLRNCQVGTIAPCGTISIILGCSSGIEPIFNYEIVRRYRGKGGEYKTAKFKHPMYQDLKDLGVDAPESAKIGARDVSHSAQIRMQEIFQKYTDGSISKTINLRKDITAEGIGGIFESAYLSGLKGLTVYREGSKEDILSTPAVKAGEHRKRDSIVDGSTIKIPYDTPWYVTINNQSKQPIEMFINAGKSGGNIQSWTEAVGRLISLYLKKGHDIWDVVRQLREIRGEMTVMRSGWIMHSGPDAISRAIVKFMDKNGLNKNAEYQTCPVCKQKSLLYESGCAYCYNIECMHSTCD